MLVCFPHLLTHPSPVTWQPPIQQCKTGQSGACLLLRLHGCAGVLWIRESGDQQRCCFEASSSLLTRLILNARDGYQMKSPGVVSKEFRRTFVKSHVLFAGALALTLTRISGICFGVFLSEVTSVLIFPKSATQEAIVLLLKSLDNLTELNAIAWQHGPLFRPDWRSALPGEGKNPLALPFLPCVCHCQSISATAPSTLNMLIAALLIKKNLLALADQ